MCEICETHLISFVISATSQRIHRPVVDTAGEGTGETLAGEWFAREFSLTSGRVVAFDSHHPLLKMVSTLALAVDFLPVFNDQSRFKGCMRRILMTSEGGIHGWLSGSRRM